MRTPEDDTLISSLRLRNESARPRNGPRGRGGGGAGEGGLSVHDAQPGDIYVDELGKLWRCMAVWSEPTVQFEMVEGYVQPPPGLMQAGGAQAACLNNYPPLPEIVKPTCRGGVSGLMWKGWQRIFRPTHP